MTTYKLTGTTQLKIRRPYDYQGRFGLPIRALIGAIKAVVGEQIQEKVRLHATQYMLADVPVEYGVYTLPADWQCEIITAIPRETLEEVGRQGLGIHRDRFGKFEVQECEDTN